MARCKYCDLKIKKKQPKITKYESCWIYVSSGKHVKAHFHAWCWELEKQRYPKSYDFFYVDEDPDITKLKKVANAEIEWNKSMEVVKG